MDDDWTKEQWIDVENEHFITWMRPAALPDFRKLWGRIEDDLDSGDYQIIVQSNYDISKYDGEKWIVLSTATYFGGKNNFSGTCYVVIGVLCL